MDPQKRFLASTLQGALDAEVLSYDDLYRHIPAQSLAEHVPTELLWVVITEGMRRAGLGFSDAGTGQAAPMPQVPVVSAPSNESKPEPAEETDASKENEEFPFEVSDDDMPPIPDDDAVVVEDVDWDDDDQDEEE